MLRVFDPGGDHGPESVSALWSLQRFFDDWYVPKLLADHRRKAPAPATIARRSVAVRWWSELMASPSEPSGPQLAAIDHHSLRRFAQLLTTAQYRRGKFGPLKPLKPWTQFRHQEEVQNVLMAAGPVAGRLVRAGVLKEVPSIYLEPPSNWPKDCWTIDQAKAIARGLTTYVPNRRRATFVNRYRLLAAATISLWFYTGHRATTYQLLTFNDLVQPRPGCWFLQICRSVKSTKQDRLAVHPVLLYWLQRIQAEFGSHQLIPWNLSYVTLRRHHEEWQTHANVRMFSPQAWRRLHATSIAETGYQTARNLAAGSLGHSSASITESHYASVRDAAILSLPDLFGGQADEQEAG